MKKFTKFAAASLCICLALPGSAFAAEGFKVTSDAFADGALVDSKHAAKGGPRECDGENISPALSWDHAPEGTKSYAVVSMDDTGRHGQGVIHWVLYDIPGAATGIEEGTAPQGSVDGKNGIGRTGYFGPCPDVGDTPHHYEFLLLALDIEPGTLEKELTWDGLKAAIKDKTLGATSTIARYAR